MNLAGMSLADWTDQPLASALAVALLHFLWQGALLTFFGWLATSTCRTAAQRYTVWLTVLVTMCVMPVLTTGWVYSPETTAAIAGDLTGASEFESAANIVASDDRTASSSSINWQQSLLLTWLIGVSVLTLRLTCGAIWLGLVMRRLEPLPPALTATVRRLSQRLGMTSVRVAASSRVVGPMAFIWFKPVVLLPASWLLEVSPTVLEAVIAHELAHLRRYDVWVNLLQRVVETVLFYHPCVWWVSREIRQERELCCDALAVQATGRAVEYAQALEAVGRMRLAWSSPLLATGMGGRRMALLQRVRHVLGLEASAASGRWPWVVAVVGLLAVGGFYAAGTGPQPRLAFAVDPVLQPEAIVSGDLFSLVAYDDDDEGDDAEERRGPPRPVGPPPGGPRGRFEDGQRGEKRDRDADWGPGDGRRGPPPPRRERDEEDDDDEDRGPRGPRNFDRPQGGPPFEAMQDLMRSVQELREEVVRLRQELNEIRGQRGEGPRPPGPPDGHRPQEPRGEWHDDGRRPPNPRESFWNFWQGEGPRHDGPPPPEGRGDNGPRPPGPPEARRDVGPDGRRGPPREGERPDDMRRGPRDAGPRRGPPEGGGGRRPEAEGGPRPPHPEGRPPHEGQAGPRPRGPQPPRREGDEGPRGPRPEGARERPRPEEERRPEEPRAETPLQTAPLPDVPVVESADLAPVDAESVAP